MITTIILDLSEVYLHGLLGIEKHLEKKHGIIIENKAWQSLTLRKLFHGEIGEEAFWQEMIIVHRMTITVVGLKEAIRQNFKEIKGTRKIIETLKENGYKLGLLSVHAREWIDYCEKEFDYHKLFDAIVYSFEVGVSKPDKKAYKIILKRLKAKPEECVFIDDNLKNLKTAKQLGIETIRFQNAQQLKKDLRALSIRI